MNGLSGSLLSLDVLRELAGDAGAKAAATRVRSALTNAFKLVGPASSARIVLDAEVLPLLRALGLDLSLTRDSATEIAGTAGTVGGPAAHVAIGPWGADLGRLGTTGASKPQVPLRWSLVGNGAVLRIIDRSRFHSRRTLDIDLQRVEEDDAAILCVVRLLETDDRGRLATLEQAASASDTHRAAVGSSLQLGVEQALRHLVAAFTRKRARASLALDGALADALTIVYRILFLLFAEARGLVPQWHPIYRRSYTIEALRPAIERSSRPAGVWQALQAISRLAHRGCRAGTLRVTPFNGRLFAPAAAPLAESIAVDDKRIREVLLAITTRPSANRRERISYADLGVEQLGSVYERVLDYSPVMVDGDVALVRSGRRKATGTFYTPAPMTDYLVRRTLAPLVRDRSADELLDLRVLDPAMGSGAFLVAACRYLADAYEQALIKSGGTLRDEVGPSGRAGFRRIIAQRCLYGVDRNPTAVQLARLSLWLCTLAADRPLTFLDHHLRAGNSLVGAAPHDILRQPPGQRRSGPGPLPLFDDEDLHERIGATIPPRVALATDPDDTADIVRQKERRLAALEQKTAPLGGWRSLADAWCAAWFRAPAERRHDFPWSTVVAALRGEPSGLPAHLERDILAQLAAISAREGFFHWELEFPEIFFEADGHSRDRPGFDAVIGNPPWDALRRASEADDDHDLTPHALTRFSRDSGCYRLQGDGHANLYQLFTERAAQLAKKNGRVGLLLPSGLIADRGCGRLRQYLFERCRVDAILSFDNRDGLFPIHRGVRFVLLTAQMDGTTDDIQSVFGLRSPRRLDDVPDEGGIDGAVNVPVSLIRKISGHELALPELPTVFDRHLVAKLAALAPALGDADGWNCRFGRELNATDDRRHFSNRGLPVLEGKALAPFRVKLSAAKDRISRSTAARLLHGRAAFDRERLGYREVAAASNRLTLIAAMIPAEAVTTHTIFCLKEPYAADVQWYLCGMFNSFVANYLVRLRGSTHVTASMMARLPVPRPAVESAAFRRVSDLARALTLEPDDLSAYTRLQGLAATLYGLDAREFKHLLGTFPLVDPCVRDASLIALQRLMDGV